MKPIKLPGPSSRSPKPKQIPYTLPFEPTMQPTQFRRTAAHIKGGQSKQPTGASPGRRQSLPQLTSSSESTTTSTRLAPRPEWGKNLQNTMLKKQARKQEKLAFKRQKKHLDDADHWTGQQWSQRTRNAGWVEATSLPANKKKEMRMLVHCPIYLAFSITMLWCVH